jgi:membrane protease YdiL (CAAX protease family)
MDQPTFTAPPPDPPELPEGAERGPRWPWWYGPVAFMAGIVGTIVVILLLAIVLNIAGVDPDDHTETMNVVGTLIQNAVLIAAAWVFASMTGKPKLWHFGLRPTRPWPAIGWTALAWVSFIFLAIIYTAVVQPDGEQTVAEDLGADESTLGLVVGAFMVIVIAPFVEELFFRGFFYRALRTSLPVWAAAGANGAIFGVIHVTSSETLPLVPVLAILGVILCLLYEKTGSLFAPIALHAFNNTIAYTAATAEDADLAIALPVSIGLGVLMLAACVVAPRYLARGAPAPA